LGEVADVAPVAAGDVTKDRVALLEHVWEDILTEVSGFVLLDVVEDDRIEQIDARIDGVAEDLAPTRLLEELVDAAVIVGDDDAVFERIGDVSEGDGGERALLAMVLDDVGEVVVGQRVAADH